MPQTDSAWLQGGPSALASWLQTNVVEVLAFLEHSVDTIWNREGRRVR